MFKLKTVEPWLEYLQGFFVIVESVLSSYPNAVVYALCSQSGSTLSWKTG